MMPILALVHTRGFAGEAGLQPTRGMIRSEDAIIVRRIASDRHWRRRRARLRLRALLFGRRKHRPRTVDGTGAAARSAAPRPPQAKQTCPPQAHQTRPPQAHAARPEPRPA